MKFPHVISSSEKCNACSRERYPDEIWEGRYRQLQGSRGGRGRGQTPLWPTREDDKYPSIRHCQAVARSELDAMQTHRKLCNIGWCTVRMGLFKGISTLRKTIVENFEYDLWIDDNFKLIKNFHYIYYWRFSQTCKETRKCAYY